MCCIKSANLVTLECDVEECTKQITEHIINAANLDIPKRSTKGRKNMFPWWNEECCRTIKERNKAFKTLKNICHKNVLDFQRKRAVPRRTIMLAKKGNWREFCSTI